MSTGIDYSCNSSRRTCFYFLHFDLFPTHERDLHGESQVWIFNPNFIYMWIAPTILGQIHRMRKLLQLGTVLLQVVTWNRNWWQVMCSSVSERVCILWIKTTTAVMCGARNLLRDLSSVRSVRMHKTVNHNAWKPIRMLHRLQQPIKMFLRSN